MNVLPFSVMLIASSDMRLSSATNVSFATTAIDCAEQSHNSTKRSSAVAVRRYGVPSATAISLMVVLCPLNLRDCDRLCALSSLMIFVPTA